MRWPPCWSAMSIMAIMMTVVMPVWKQAAQREKEEELIFRGQQYAHAIGLFQRKFANAFPPNIDVLVEQRFLRKKFKDPITNDDFLPLPARRRRAGHRRAWTARPVPAAAAAGGSHLAADRTPPPAGHRSAGGSGRTQTQPGGALRGVSADRHAGRGRRHDGGHQRRRKQEQGSINSPL